MILSERESELGFTMLIALVRGMYYFLQCNNKHCSKHVLCFPKLNKLDEYWIESNNGVRGKQTSIRE